MTHLHVLPIEVPLKGEIAVPPSKYHAHRALIMSSLARGSTRIVGQSSAEHVQHTIRALRMLGTQIELTDEGYLVRGRGYRAEKSEIPLGSSGSTAYFLVGLGCLAQNGPVTFDADTQLRNRPIRELLDALGKLGVHLQARDSSLPVTVHPGLPDGGDVRISGMLSQWASGLLLIAPLATHDTTVRITGEFNERQYIRLTVRMLRKFGIDVEVSPDERSYFIPHGQTYTAPDKLVLCSDVSSAAYGVVAAAIHPGEVLFTGIASSDDHPEREILDVLGEMGAPLQFNDDARELRMSTDGHLLHGIIINCRDFPDAIPALCVAAAFAAGTTVLENVAHARRKESDRVQAALQLAGMGARITATENRIVIEGVRRLRGAALDSLDDHRVLMSLAVAATAADGASTLTFPHAYRISYPHFLKDMRSLGLDMRVGEYAHASENVDA